MTFYESNPEVRPTGVEPAEYTEMPDPPPPPAPATAADPEPEETTVELVADAMALPTRGPLLVLAALVGLGAIVVVMARLLRSRRS